jgi:hypothetical protein
MDSDVVALLASDPTVCLDDYFHVAMIRTGEDDTPATANRDEYHLNEVESQGREVECHKKEEEVSQSALGIYMVENHASKMTGFLTRVAQSCKVTGHNIESWVTAVESKLDNIGTAPRLLICRQTQ